MTAAEEACLYIFQRVRRDPRFAYHMLATESMEHLYKACAPLAGMDVATFRARHDPDIKTERCNA